MSLTFAAEDTPAIPLHLIRSESLADWRRGQPAEVQGWLDRIGFAAAAGSVAVVPGPGGEIIAVAAGLGSAKDRARGRFLAAMARAALPKGRYRFETDLTGADLDEAALGWLLAGYRFDRYRNAGGPADLPELVAPSGIDATRLVAIAAGEALTRDLINTPASDMGPADLQAAFEALAAPFGATIETTVGDALRDANLPLIHTVGRAASQDPRLIDLRWGTAGPRLTLVGKGVCFDTGGLNLKPGASMGLMKKDMGGAAAVAGLAQTIMALGLPVQLRVLVPAVENAVAGNAFRPGDILTSRKGLTVEINNTDAEGRLVLADALALGDEETPDLMISMATLTGAARVAVGADLAPFYATDDALADALSAAGSKVRDPLWRMPFWDPYEPQIEPGIADLDNAPKGGFAGSITAALFLRRFVETAGAYAHFDIYGWQQAAAPARPKGGVGQGARAILAALPEALGI